MCSGHLVPAKTGVPEPHSGWPGEGVEPFQLLAQKENRSFQVETGGKEVLWLLHQGSKKEPGAWEVALRVGVGVGVSHWSCSRGLGAGGGDG